MRDIVEAFFKNKLWWSTEAILHMLDVPLGLTLTVTVSGGTGSVKLHFQKKVQNNFS